MNEPLIWTPRALVCKYSADQVTWVCATTGLTHPEAGAMSVFCRPYDELTVAGNVLTTAGHSRLMSSLVGGAAFTHSVTRLGVGSDFTPARSTDLRLGSWQYFRVMDKTYPELTGTSVVFKATFGPDDAVFDWRCWGLDVMPAGEAVSSSSEAVLINRKVHDMGAKPAGEIWTLTCEVTLALSKEDVYVSNFSSFLGKDR